MRKIRLISSALVDSLVSITTMSGRDAHFGSHIERPLQAEPQGSFEEIIRKLATIARRRKFSIKENSVKILEPSVEGFILLLERYSNMLHTLSDTWRLIASGTEEDREGHPPEVWIRDSEYARDVANSMDEAVEIIRTVWSNTPTDMQEIVEIKIRKVREIDGTD